MKLSGAQKAGVRIADLIELYPPGPHVSKLRSLGQREVHYLSVHGFSVAATAAGSTAFVARRLTINPTFTGVL